MLDEEIIKALECCIPNDMEKCLVCPFHRECIKQDKNHLAENALDLINRQKAEIEQLEKDKESFANSYAKAVARNLTIKAEAVKEVAERLKKKAVYEWRLGKCKGTVDVVEIDNLVKEMVGEV